MDILKYGLLIIVILVLGYVLFRVLSMAIFKSWFDVKKSEERGDTYENHKVDRRNGNKSGGNRG